MDDDSNLPDAPWASEEDLPDAPWVTAPSTTDILKSAVTDIPSEVMSAASTAAGKIGSYLNPFSPENRAANERLASAPSFLSGLGGQLQHTMDVGKGLAAIPELAMSPLTGASRSVIGHGLEATGDTYEGGKAEADKLMMAIAPKAGPFPMAAKVAPPVGPFDVMLSEGQKTGSLPLIKSEQSALAGRSGDRAQAIAQTFSDQQKAQLAAARQNISGSLSPTGDIVAESPQAAGTNVSEALQNAKAAAKANVSQLYTQARGMPGEIDANAFRGIGDRIRDSLSNRDEPVIVDDALTPYASRAIQDINNNVAKLNIPNVAGEAPPDPNSIVGVTLNGVDQWRKRLSGLRSQAFQSGNAADGRATQAVLDAFDDHINQSVDNGLFNGDQLAVKAWNNARAANADYKSTFFANKRDPVGRVVEKITGGNLGEPAIGNDVADFIYGGTGVNPNSLNVGVANRVKSIVGDQSPTWGAVKQGLFSRLTETPQGVTDWGPARVAQNLNKFLNGDGLEMAQSVYSPDERQLLQNYADLLRQIEPPPQTMNPSKTSNFVVPALRMIGSKMGMVAGAILGHTLIPNAPPLAAEGIGAGFAAGANKIADVLQARKIAAQMPEATKAMAQWQKAAEQAARVNSPINQRQLTFAASNLSRQLAPFGINLHDIMAQAQAPTTGEAKNDQNVIPRPPTEQHDAGQIGNQRDIPSLPVPPNLFDGQTRVPRKSGGSVKSSHQHLVTRLMRLAESAKKVEKNRTKPLLNVPDETVAKALEVAQKSI